MSRALIAVIGCWIAAAGCWLAATAPVSATTAPAAPPLLQSWSDTGQIAADDDWSGVPAVVGHRGDGLVAEPGADPRSVRADGSGTPLDVTANRTDPRAVGLAAGVAEFELADPVVAIQGSATASAPHLLLSLDARGRARLSVRLVLRDIDASAADATEPVAVQYRVGAGGDFATVSGGYVADATSGPREATRVTRVSANLPAAAAGQPLVQIRVITTNAAGQDEWIGIDDIEATASAHEPGACPPPAPSPEPGQGPGPRPAAIPGSAPWGNPDVPGEAGPELTGLRLAPETFTPARRGPAILRRGPAILHRKPVRRRRPAIVRGQAIARRGGATLRFRLSRSALVRFDVEPARDLRSDAGSREQGWRVSGGRFAVRGRRGLNRLRFSGRVRGRALAVGTYTLRAVAMDRAGRPSAPASVRFRIGPPVD